MLTLQCSLLAVQESWSTPVELFKPYYAEALAAYVMDQAGAAPSEPLVLSAVGLQSRR